MAFFRTAGVLALMALHAFVSSAVANDLSETNQVLRAVFTTNSSANRLHLIGGLGAPDRLTVAFEGGLKAKDFWNDHDYAFAYGKTARGSMILMAWKEHAGARAISLRELARLYMDERLAGLQNEQDFQKWKTVRRDVLGAFLEVKRGSSSFQRLNSKPKSVPENLYEMEVSEQPLVIEIFPYRVTAVEADASRGRAKNE